MLRSVANIVKYLTPANVIPFAWVSAKFPYAATTALCSATVSCGAAPPIDGSDEFEKKSGN